MAVINNFISMSDMSSPYLLHNELINSASASHVASAASIIKGCLAWTQFPEIAASQAMYQPYGPTNLKSAPFLAGPEFDAHRDWLPTADVNLPYAILMDEAADGQIGGPQAEIWFEAQGKK